MTEQCHFDLRAEQGREHVIKRNVLHSQLIKIYYKIVWI